MLNMSNSYDVFDTLIGRLCYDGHTIFHILEKITNLPDFKANRIKYESSTKNFDQTYQHLEQHYKKNMDEVKQKELDLEYELCFPIVKYLNQIKQNDIFISDMYLSKINIMKLLNKHVPTLENELFVSYGGKMNSTVWKNKTITGKIACHFGDNLVSDYKNPTAHQIKAVHITDVKKTPFETTISTVNPHIGNVLRATRLAYHLNGPLSKLFIDYVLPFSIMTCLKIKQLCLENQLETVVFLTRDGYWFKEVYNILYPKDNTKYVYFSRLLVSNHKHLVINEINTIPGKKFIFDLQGSGRTFQSLNLSDCFYFMCILSHDSKLTHYLYKHGEKINIVKEVIEDVFIAPHGSANKYNNNVIQLLEPEHDTQLFTPYMQGLQLFKKYWTILSNYFDNANTSNYNKLNEIINHFHDNMNQSHIKSCINCIVPHVNNHTGPYVKHPLTFYSQIEQDKYYVENIIKYRPNRTFIEIGGYDGITGSNTYFLEQQLNWDGIVIECNPILAEKCRKNRKCYVCDKALYKHDNEQVTFTIPCGGEIAGGREQLGGIKNELKPESLNAFKKSYNKSRDITVNTININTLLEQQKMYTIDYVSLDVEGSELSILQSWDFQKHKILFLTVEHGNVMHYQRAINTFLTQNGFTQHRNNKWDDEYVWNDSA